MKFPSPPQYFFCLMFCCYFISVVCAKVDAQDLVVADPHNSINPGRGECGKQGVECRKGNIGSAESVLDEDYIYTNSNLP